jgi:hypothetical protein
MRLRYLFATAAVAILSTTAMAAPLGNSYGPFGGAGGIEVIPVHNECHSSWRTHGGSYPEHRHDYDGDGDCVTYYRDDDDDDDYDDCHREVLRHYLSDYGRVWHRHRGSRCRVELYEHEGGPTPGYGGCIQVGPAVICGGGGGDD